MDETTKRLFERVRREQSDSKRKFTFPLVMLGHSGVGKTVLMTTMFSHLFNRKDEVSVQMMEDITSSTQTYNSGTRIISKKQQINDLYEKIYDKRSNYNELLGFNRNAQPGTQIMTLYNFIAYYREFELIRMSWMDYKGGALSPENIRNNDKDLSEIYNYFSSSYAVMITADSELYLKNKVVVERELDFLTQLLLMKFKTDNRRMIVIFLLTKVNSFALKYETKRKGFTSFFESYKHYSIDRELVKTASMEIFRDAYKKFSNDGHYCSIVPVACGFSGTYNQGNNIVRLLNYQVELPLFLALESFIKALSIESNKNSQSLGNYKGNFGQFEEEYLEKQKYTYSNCLKFIEKVKDMSFIISGIA